MKKDEFRKTYWPYSFRIIDCCPLFSPLPFADAPPRSPISRCIEIIIEARLLWGIAPYNPYGYEFKNSPWPKPKDVSKYPGKMILAAREIWRLRGSLYQYAVNYNPRPGEPSPWYQKKDGLFDVSNAIDTIEVKDILYWINTLKRIPLDFVPTFAILAILAIKEAQWALHNILEEREEDDPEVLERVQVASNLLARAKELKAETEIKKDEGIIEKLHPHAEKGMKAAKDLKKARETKLKANRKPVELLQHATNIICKNIRNNLRHKSGIAQIIIDKVKIGYDGKNAYIEKIASWLETSNYYPIEDNDNERKLKVYIRKRIKIPPKPRT